MQGALFPSQRAVTGELDALVALLARAFQDEPVQQWLFPIAEERFAASGLWFKRMLTDAFRFGEVWRLFDYSAVAVWLRTAKSSELDALSTPSTAIASKLELLEAELDTRKPIGECAFLAAIATDSAMRRQGRGTSVLIPGLRMCDRRGLVAYLETSEPRSTELYRKLGFSKSAEFSIDDGPRIWCMRRHPLNRERSSRNHLS